MNQRRPAAERAGHYEVGPEELLEDVTFGDALSRTAPVAPFDPVRMHVVRVAMHRADIRVAPKEPNVLLELFRKVVVVGFEDAEQFAGDTLEREVELANKADIRVPFN